MTTFPRTRTRMSPDPAFPRDSSDCLSAINKAACFYSNTFLAFVFILNLLSIYLLISVHIRCLCTCVRAHLCQACMHVETRGQPKESVLCFYHWLLGCVLTSSGLVVSPLPHRALLPALLWTSLSCPKDTGISDRYILGWIIWNYCFLGNHTKWLDDKIFRCSVLVDLPSFLNIS